jgi:acetamidase/formamidase
MKPLVLALGLFALSSPAWAQNPPSLTGRWSVTLDQFGYPTYAELQLKQDGATLSGRLFGDPLEGKVEGGVLHLTTKNKERPVSGEGRVVGDHIEGFATLPDTFHGRPDRIAFTAVRVPEKSGAPPQRHEFAPTRFERRFSGLTSPVLRVAPGDTIHTTTVDAGGTDETGVRRSSGGNPQTGPFYVEGAMPGDTLAVHIRRLRLNRDYAINDDAIVPRGVTPQLAVQMKDNNNPIRWRLDREKGLATLEKPGDHTAAFAIPVKPMLGCIATAPPPAGDTPFTGDSGPYGGNMDFNEVVEGATVYLPVFVPGALLYFGDGHALQGDGEMNGNALETSLEVEVTVDLIPARRIPGPRLENETHIMGMGLAGSIDDAFRQATANLADWLTKDYHLTASEVGLVIGSSVEYRISEVADRNAGVVAKLSKARLALLTEGAPRSAAKTK